GGGKGDEVAASGVTSRARRLVSLQRRAAARLPRLPPPRGADFLRGRDLAAVAFTRLVRRLAAGAAFFFAPPLRRARFAAVPTARVVPAPPRRAERFALALPVRALRTVATSAAPGIPSTLRP